MPEKLTVHNPLGFPPKITSHPMASRLDGLDGKTVYLVDCRYDDSNYFVEQLQASFAEHFPSVKTVPVELATVLEQDDPGLWKQIQENGDAAVLGVGH
jgi:hypothetical protein